MITLFTSFRRSRLAALVFGVSMLGLVACDAQNDVLPAADTRTFIAVSDAKGGYAPATAEAITVSDTGTITAMADPACLPRSADRGAREALARGSVDGTDAKALLAHAARLSDCRRARGLGVQDALLDGVGPINWDPSHDQPRLGVVPGEAMALLRGNGSGKGSARRGDPLVIAGLDGARTLALTASPMRHAYRGRALDPNLQTLMENGVDWLSAGASTGAFTVTIAQMSQSYYFPDRLATRAWLDAAYGDAVTYNAQQACDGEALSGCLEGADLLILGSAETGDAEAVAQAVADAKASGVGVLYMHIDGGRTEVSDAVLPLLGLINEGDNYWSHPTLEMADAERGADTVDPEGDALLELMSGLEAETLTFDASVCGDHTCPDDSPYTLRIMPVLNGLKSRLGANDVSGQPLFTLPGRDFDKTAVLLGDLYKRSARFPLHARDGARPQDLIRARFTDHAQSFLREGAPAYADLGNHGRTGAAVPMGSANVELVSRAHYRSAGVYARPGQTVRVTRTDDAEVQTSVRINLVREGATRWFGNNGYTRPARTSSPDLPVAPGETLSFTSPHGGPVFIRFGNGAADAKSVSFTFDNVAQHPVWRGPEDDAAFVAAVDAGEHDWAEIVTDGFEVHSRMDKMQETLARGLAPSEIAALTARNFSDYAHALAGFTGTGITEIAEVHGWAREAGIPLYPIDVVKHMNADQANCGYGCSGNPYDAFWAFDPVGHGDLHELGHGLERRRMRFAGQSGHTITNPYSYYAKARFQVETGGTTDCQRLPYRTLFERAQAAAQTDNPRAAMAAHDHSGWSYGAAVNYQTMMGAEGLGLLDNGQHLLGRLHVIERAFDKADDNDAAWAETADAIGFGGFAREDARALSSNDWLLVATSHALGRDMSDWFTVWGHDFGDAALEYVAPLPDFPVRFYLASDTAACEAFPTESVAIDGVSEWPDAVGQKVPHNKPESVPQALSLKPDSHDLCEHDGAR